MWQFTQQYKVYSIKNTWSPDTLSRGWDTTVKTFMPFPKEPVDHLALLVHHKSLHFIHIGTPVATLYAHTNIGNGGKER